MALVLILDLIANSLVMKAALNEGALNSKWLVAVPWLNFFVTAACIVMIAWYCWLKWSDKNKNKKTCRKYEK